MRSRRTIALWLLATLFLPVILTGPRATLPDEMLSQLLSALPAPTDWVECGTILTAGAEGEWDYYLWGGFANSVVKKDGVYYLYYQGANGYDEAEGTVTWRAIGVATSPDGVHFTKYEQNPVLTWFPNHQLEEGAVSSGAFVDEQGQVALYYGANTWRGGNLVNANGRLALSPDGFSFTDHGVVLEHTDRSVWGAGDELFPIIGFQDGGRWFSYYIPNGTRQRRQLGVAWGNQLNSLVHSTAAQSGGRAIAVWGPGSAVELEDDVYALFLNHVYGPEGPVIEVRTVSLSAPGSLSEPLQRYQFDHVWQATVLLDRETATWFMYYRSAEQTHYGVKVAAADGRALSCPLPPPSPLVTPPADTDASTAALVDLP